MRSDLPPTKESGKWTCSHRETTEPDDEGFVLCLRCGGAIIVRLTRHIFDKTVETMKFGK